MAFDWITANTGVMYRLGRIVKAVNAHLTNANTTLPAQLKYIVDPAEAADIVEPVDSIYSLFTGLRQQEVGNRSALASYADSILTHRASVLEQLSLVSPDINSVLTALINQQSADSQTVKRAAVTLGTVTAGGSNVGNGTVLTTARLDGVQPPILGGFSHLRYAGLLSELCVPSETMRVECVRDSYRDGTTAGSEQHAWRGIIADSPFGYETEGSGEGPGLASSQGVSKVADGSFENWTNTNTPSSWTIDNGTAGTHIWQETGGSNIYRGSAGLKFLGTGAQATMGISQAFTAATLQARRMYLVTVRMKASSVPAAGTFGVHFSGTGYSPGSGESISIAAASLPTSFTLYNAFVLMPSAIPSDFKLVIQVSNTLSNTVAVYVDAVDLVDVTYHGGVGAAVVNGSTPFVVGDSFSWTVAQTTCLWQDFFRRKYRAQLLSVGGSAETILDSLCT